MKSILHISDLHFGPHYIARVGEALQLFSARIEPDSIVVSGDFTHRAKPSEFEAAAEFLATLPNVPTMCVPGNHDVPLYRVFERLFRPHDLYKAHISANLDSVIATEEMVLVGLDSTAPYHATVNGRIWPDQLDFASRAFANYNTDALRIVVAHHHFAPAPDFDEALTTLPHAKRSIDRFIATGVELVLGGHLHRAYIGNSLDIYPGVRRDYGISIVQCGTTTSRRGRGREREKNSLNMIHFDSKIIRIVHYLFMDDAGTFLPTSEHLFPRRRLGYLGPRFEEQ